MKNLTNTNIKDNPLNAINRELSMLEVLPNFINIPKKQIKYTKLVIVQ